MLYIILGMHKSGTTVVAEILHRSGVTMGEQLDGAKDYATGNKYERLSTQMLNKDILQCHEQASLDLTLPPHLQLTAQQRAQMQALLQQESSNGGDWGFKDPRTCLTYPVWQPWLPPHRLILIYRHPVQVYLHYRHKASGNRLAKLALTRKILRSWTLHNRQMLAIAHAAVAPYLVLSYERLMNEQTEFERLCAFTGRALTDARKTAYYQRDVHRSAIVSIADSLLGILGEERPLTVWKALENLRKHQL